MSVIRAEELTKQYGNKVCVDHLSFELGKECVLGFIGPNGAGKTTTMRMLCGIMPPSSGKAFIQDLNVADFPVKARQSLGYLPENAPLPGTTMVASFLNYCGNMRGLSGKELKKAVERVTEECELSSVLQEECESLSKGFRRRVCLAQAIMHEPQALVLDEPTDGLDPNQKREIRALIRKLSTKSAIIVSTHILEEIDAVCDRVLTINCGKKVFDGSVAQFRELVPESFSVKMQIQLPASDKTAEAEKILQDMKNITILSAGKDKEREELFTVHFQSANGEKNPEKEFIDVCIHKNWQILSVRTKDAGLDEVFAHLAKGGEKV